MGNIYSIDTILDSTFDMGVPIFLDFTCMREFARWSRIHRNARLLTEQIEKGLEIIVFDDQLRSSISKNKYEDARKALVDSNIEIDTAEWISDDDDFAREMQKIYFHDSTSAELHAKFMVLARRESRTHKTRIITTSIGFNRVIDADIYMLNNVSGGIDLPANFNLFVDLEIHERLKQSVAHLFHSGDFMGCILEGVKELGAYLRQTDPNFEGKDGWSLVNEALACKFIDDRRYQNAVPRLKLSHLDSDSDRNEHKGYYHFIGGAFSAFRNIGAHHAQSEDARRMRFDNKKKAIKVLSFISLLMEKIDDRVRN